MMRTFLPTLLLATLTTTTWAQSIFPMPNGRDVHDNIIVDGLTSPARLAVDGQGALWVACAIDGRIFRRSAEGELTHIGTIELDAPSESGARGHLTGLAVRTESSGTTLFVAYTSNTSVLTIARARVVANALDDVTTILDVDNVPYNRRSAILPMVDGTLLISVPSFDTPAPLSPATLTGKVIRIHEDGSPAADNPFANPTTSATPMAYVYTYGHRNVSGLASADGTLSTTYAVEAGPVGADEVNHLSAGRNYGWFRHQGYCGESSETNTCPEMTFSRIPFDVAWYGSQAIPSFAQSLLIATVTNPALLIARTSSTGKVIDHNPQADPVSTYIEEPWRVLTFQRDGEPERVTCVATMTDGSIAVGTETTDGRGRIHRLFDPVSTSVAATTDATAISAAPLPAHSVLTFSRAAADATEQAIVLTDLTGRRHVSATFASGSTQASVPVHQLPSGTYIARIGTWTSIVVVRH